jgi:hypothetical protein
MTIDEKGMAQTAERKAEIARRTVAVARDYGVPPDSLVFDSLTFTLATGGEEYRRSAVETLEGIRRIKSENPGVFTCLGVSNVSFGLSRAAREVVNSVFLYHAVQAGLDLAIVNPKDIRAYKEIPEEERALAEDLVLDRRDDALARLIAHFSGSANTAALFWCDCSAPTRKMLQGVSQCQTPLQIGLYGTLFCWQLCWPYRSFSLCASRSLMIPISGGTCAPASGFWNTTRSPQPSRSPRSEQTSHGSPTAGSSIWWHMAFTGHSDCSAFCSSKPRWLSPRQ